MPTRTRIPRRILVTLLIVAAPACTAFRSSESLRASGDEAIARGDSTRALKSYQALLGKDESDPHVFATVGALLRAKNTIRDRTLSQKILERGLMKYPDDVGILLETGKTYYAQTLYGDASSKFKRVLALDPDNCDAHYFLGLNDFRHWKHVQIYHDDLIDSQAHFQRVIECDPARYAAHFKLAFSYYVLQDTAACRRVTEQFGIAHRDRPEPYFLLGALAFDKGHFDEADEAFAQAFLRLSDGERDLYEDIILLLPEDEDDTAIYRLSSDEKRQEMRRAFWAESDPDLTTPTNERFVEHTHRMFIADARFAIARMGLRGWDTERGKAYVKFGPPQAYGSTLAGGFTSGRMESWTYPNGLTLIFRDEFLNGNYIVPMDARYAFISQIIHLDPPITSIEYTRVVVPGTIDAFAFKGNSVTSDVYLAYRVDRDSLDIFVDLDEVKHFVARSAVYDGAWQAQRYDADTLTTAAFVADNTPGQGVIIRRLELPFDEHHLAVVVEDDLALTQASMRVDITTLRFLGAELSTSDILFYRDAASETGGDWLERSGRRFYPKLGARYNGEEKLRVYLELYNLGVKGGQSRYEITYSIYPDTRDQGVLSRIGGAIRRMTGFINSPEPIISQTLLRTGAAHDDFEDLAIDIGTLDPGRYILEIALRDTNEDELATTMRGFVKEPAGR